MKILPIKLRPHHFLCIQGYRGFNYNNNQVNIWDMVVGVLRKNPDTDVFISRGKDNLCANCPTIKNLVKNNLSCAEKNVQELDDKVKLILDIEYGGNYKYGSIVEVMKKKVNRQKHQELCSKCLWWLRGLCRDSFE